MENRISPEPEHSNQKRSADQQQLYEMESGEVPSNYQKDTDGERIQFGDSTDKTGFRPTSVSPQPQTSFKSYDGIDESPIGSKEVLMHNERESDKEQTYFGGDSSITDNRTSPVPEAFNYSPEDHQLNEMEANGNRSDFKKDNAEERIQFGDSPNKATGFRPNRVSPQPETSLYSSDQHHSSAMGSKERLVHKQKEPDEERIQFGDPSKHQFSFKDNRISPVPEPFSYTPADHQVNEKAPSEKRSYSRKDSDDQRIQFGGDESDREGGGVCGLLLVILSGIIVLLTVPFSLFVCFKVVQEYERAVIFRLGRLLSGGAKGPGIFFVLPCIENYSKVDLRTVSFDVPPQEILTKDSVTVSVDAVVYYRISNPTVSVANVTNAHHSTRLLAQTTLRNVLGTKSLAEILSDRESISLGVQNTLDDATDRWGIKVERTEIKDVRLPTQLQRAMAAEAEATREARAKVIAAEGEQQASRALREAAQIISGSPSALQLRYLQTLNQISAEKNSTIVFPLPIDLLQSFIKK